MSKTSHSILSRPLLSTEVFALNLRNPVVRSGKEGATSPKEAKGPTRAPLLMWEAIGCSLSTSTVKQSGVFLRFRTIVCHFSAKDGVLILMIHHHSKCPQS